MSQYVILIVVLSTIQCCGVTFIGKNPHYLLAVVA